MDSPLAQGAEGPIEVVLSRVLSAAIGASIVMRRCEVRSFWPYIADAGTLAWLGPVPVRPAPGARVVPIVPFLPRTQKSRPLMHDAPALAAAWMLRVGRFARMDALTPASRG